MADLKTYIPNLGQNGSVTVGSSDVNPNLVQFASVVVPSASILTMVSTPVTIIPAQGANTGIVVTDCAIDVSSGTAYAAGGAVGLTFSGSATYITLTVGSSLFYGTTGSTAYIASSTSSYQIPSNTAVSLTNSGAAFTTGTESVTVNVWYAVIPVGH